MKIPNVTIQQLLEAGVHLGHKTLRWNPKMKKYIFGKRDSIHIIDLTQTLELTKTALAKVFEVISNNGKILFVSTKLTLEVISPLENGNRLLPASIDEENKMWVASAVNELSELVAIEADKEAVRPFNINWSNENPSPVDEVIAAWLPVNAKPIDAVSITSKWNPKVVPLVINPKWLWDNWRWPSDPV